MKSYAPIISLILFGIFAVALGFRAAIYAGLVLIGLIGLVVVGALVWTQIDNRKLEANQPTKAASEKKDAASQQTPV